MEESRRNAATKHEQKASILAAFNAVDQYSKEMEDARYEALTLLMYFH